MSASGQRISFDFYTEYRAKYLNSSGFGIIPKGVYSGGSGIAVSGNSVVLPVGLAFYIHSKSGSGASLIQVGVRIELTAEATVSGISSSAPWICASFAWTESQEMAAVFSGKALEDILEDDVVLCRVQTLGGVIQTTLDFVAQTRPNFEPKSWTVRPHQYVSAAGSTQNIVVNSVSRVIGKSLVTPSQQVLTVPAKPTTGVRYDAVILRSTGAAEIRSGEVLASFPETACDFWKDADPDGGSPQGCVLAVIKRYSSRAADDVLVEDIQEIEAMQIVDSNLKRYIHSDKLLYIHSDKRNYTDGDLTHYIHADKKNYLLPKAQKYLYDFFPVGTIMMFDGVHWKNNLVDSENAASNSLPGWAVCDGLTVEGYVTPNMINQFARGRANNSSSASGGVDSVTLSSTHLPPHTHEMSHPHGFDASRLYTTGGDHRHWMFRNTTGSSRLMSFHWNAVSVNRSSGTDSKYDMMVSNDGVDATLGLSGKEASAAAWLNSSVAAGSTTTHSHGINSSLNPSLAFSGRTGSAGGGVSFSILPPWKSVIFIVKYKDTSYSSAG
jgi:hypothetical protein